MGDAEEHNSSSEKENQETGEQNQQVKKKKSAIPEKIFFKYLKENSVLLDKRQSVDVAAKKVKAVQALIQGIQTDCFIELTPSQVRKKIDNMKGRVKSRVDKKETLTKEDTMLRKLMEEKDSTFNKMAGKHS